MTDQDAREEIRSLFEAWWRATAAADLEGLMEPIAADVVSYEHGGPLQYRGIAAVREVCRAGLEQSPGPVAWDVPDIEIVVDGDLAVAWGLDRIRLPDDGVEIWSRGTRVFRRIEGRWQLVHQHLSHPAEAASALADDARPASAR